MDIDSYTINELGTKVRSKSELYRTLITEGKIMLPPMKGCNHDYLQGIMIGTKKVKFPINLWVFL